MAETVIFWFRRDLRLEDNTALFHALKRNERILPLFIFDFEILDKFPAKNDARLTFIHQQVQHLKKSLEGFGSSLLVKHGKPIEVFRKLKKDYNISSVYANHDYEPYAVARDKAVKELLEQEGVKFHTYKDQVIFEKDEILKKDGKPYTVYTPYSKKWIASLSGDTLEMREVLLLKTHFFKCDPFPEISLEDIGFRKSSLSFPPAEIDRELIRNYERYRDIPALDGTSRLGLHLRFGTISIRKLVRVAKEFSDTFLGELIWREFFMMILWHFPESAEHAFKRKYDNISWRNKEKEFEAWCNGRTGYPMVDAGMRQLNETGFMHNRVRMIAGSFLVKHLLIDWRWGETYFAEKLLDYEQASNVGNWQWVAGSGCDAAPYFRIFNPLTQQQKFDRDNEYVRRWVPEWNTEQYPEMLVNHKEVRERALKEYKQAIK
ncbi:MAG: DNA photolyase family protein [Bacteroidales bacterium]|nr:DNA photolyase family protein [Bacteroidales bacterium]MCF8345231.1 DNA photolyase family protein [Bacteroidales bacterium]MCF8377305.1 DNA photolyase family protein [Bacteroidales bacterium]MCF8401391.1 DNA photolyase family protein [Bacteroidales bacterium]